MQRADACLQHGADEAREALPLFGRHYRQDPGALLFALTDLQERASAPPPRNCTAANQQWTQGSHSCQGAVTAANHKATQTLTDNTGTSTGIAVYRCWDGSWQKQSGGCGVACLAGTRSWTVGSSACTASITAGIHNRQTTVTDSVGTERGHRHLPMHQQRLVGGIRLHLRAALHCRHRLCRTKALLQDLHKQVCGVHLQFSLFLPDTVLQHLHQHLCRMYAGRWGVERLGVLECLY